MKKTFIVCLIGERDLYLKRYLSRSPMLVKSGIVLEKLLLKDETVFFIRPDHPMSLVNKKADQVIVSDLAFEGLKPDQYEAINRQIKLALARGAQGK